MTKFAVSLEGAIEVTPEFDGEVVDPVLTVEEHLDEVMEELLRLEAEDPNIEAALANGSVTFSVVVAAPNPIDAIGEASSLVRTAIHAAGGGTPDWPAPDSHAWAVRLIGVGSRELVSA